MSLLVTANYINWEKKKICEIINHKRNKENKQPYKNENNNNNDNNNHNNTNTNNNNNDNDNNNNNDDDVIFFPLTISSCFRYTHQERINDQEDCGGLLGRVSQHVLEYQSPNRPLHCNIHIC